jgi:hypothetical protein
MERFSAVQPARLFWPNDQVVAPVRRRRPVQAISERELTIALGSTGRQVGLCELGAWRRAGLLPPFASCGTGAGRSYYWREPDILDRAEAVYDALSVCARIDSALIAIWLAGFDVPLERLRRALLHRVRIQAATGAADGPSSNPRLAGHGALIELAQPAGSHTLLEAPWENILSRSDLRRHLDRLSHLYRPLTENIALIHQCPDADLLKARRYLLGLLSDRGSPAKAPSSDTLFLFLLALVRSGHSQILQKIEAFEPARQAAGQAGRTAKGRVLTV